MKRFSIMLLSVISIFIILGAIWFMTREPRVDPTISSLLKIEGIRKNTGDILNETGVTTVDDIKYKIDGNKVMFHYGKHLFYVNKKDINDKDFQERFNKLGLSVKLNENGTLIVKYHKQLVKEII